MTTSSIVSKVWNYCNILRDDDVNYGDYLEQLKYFLFLKMVYEYSKPPYSRQTIIEKKYDLESLRSLY
ncbi:MAG: type I restriction-modification system subunit M N-terminal domain-containing protein [Ignavibacteria bacterium]